MADQWIGTLDTPTQPLKFRPGGPAATFDITVINESDRFASFQVDLLHGETDTDGNHTWYQLSPEVASKKPPGDRTQFHVAITDNPLPGLTGRTYLTVLISSPELDKKRRVVIPLELEEGGTIAIGIELPVRQFQATPLDSFQLPVYLHNPSRKIVNAKVRLLGLQPGWVVGSVEQTLQLVEGANQTTFVCQLPDTMQAVCDRYPFIVEVSQESGAIAQDTGTLEILPAGQVDFGCTPEQQTLPPRDSRLRWGSSGASFALEFRNHSNVVQRGTVEISGDDRRHLTLQLLPHQVTLRPGETQPIHLGAIARRRWWGRRRRQVLTLNAQLADSRSSLQNDSQVVELTTLPLLPLWLQGLSGLLLLYLLWWVSWLNPGNPLFGHHAAVNSVEFNGTADEVVSGSSDETLLRWRVSGFFNPFLNQEIGTLGDAQKAVRVVRHRPVNNDWVAAGLENGEIQLWQLSNPGRQIDFSYQRGDRNLALDDRVLALAFSQDSRYLFSGYGSGAVLQWRLPYPQSSQVNDAAIPQRSHSFDFAVYALALVGDDDSTVAVGGRYGQLVLWNWQTDTVTPIDAGASGGQDVYITSISRAANQPYLLAVADNQGNQSLWNLKPCLQDEQACEQLDSWQGHGGQAVRAVALSDYGCYLASGGADGRVVLWTLTPNGQRVLDRAEGTELERSPHPINTVDIKVWKEFVFVAAGHENSQVSVRRRPRNPDALCDALAR